MMATLQQVLPLKPQSPAPMVAGLRGVTKSYGRVKALNKVDFSVRAGELVALLGPNGAGKTTAVKLLLGLAAPNAGLVNVFGGNPVHPEVRMRIGAMLQTGKVPETQRVLFALAVCGDPDILFLDEPTVGMDVEARRSLWGQIRNLVARGKSVLLTTHYLQEADSLADRVVVINQGSIIAEGTSAEIKSQTAGRRIRCVSRLDLNSLRHMAGVLEVRQDRDALEIHATEAEAVVRELLNRDPTLSDLEVTSAGLEEAFLALTKENVGTGEARPSTRAARRADKPR